MSFFNAFLLKKVLAGFPITSLALYPVIFVKAGFTYTTVGIVASTSFVFVIITESFDWVITVSRSLSRCSSIFCLVMS